MSNSQVTDVWYPTVDDIVMIHKEIIEEDPCAERGIRDESQIEFVLEYIQGHVGKEPPSIHHKAFHLMRLIASNHWFVDGNKRTALNTTELFYIVNGYELEYGDDIRSILKLFSVRERLIDRNEGAEYLRDRTSMVRIDFDELEIDELDPIEGFVFLLIALSDRLSDEDPNELLRELLSDIEIDAGSMRDDLGLTRRYGTTVNIDEDSTDTDGG
jgi:death-on-curing protein